MLGCSWLILHPTFVFAFGYAFLPSMTFIDQSLHITSFLTKLTVTCITNPPPSTLVSPRAVTAPPFAIVTTSDRPFLARLVLEYAGSENPPMEIEHWVEVRAKEPG
jgi:hypothetical protein